MTTFKGGVTILQHRSGIWLVCEGKTLRTVSQHETRGEAEHAAEMLAVGGDALMKIDRTWERASFTGSADPRGL